MTTRADLDGPTLRSPHLPLRLARSTVPPRARLDELFARLTDWPHHAPTVAGRARPQAVTG